jgi:dihydropteroate synthase
MASLQARLGSLYVGDNYPVAVMGVINLDPQSFYSSSYASSPKQAISAASKMIEKGVDILDIGGASTAPGTSPVSVSEEINRIKPIIKYITENWDTPVSIDTQHASVAESALSKGASIVNDVSGLKADVSMAAIIKDTGASSIVMAYGSQPGDQTTISDIISNLQESLAIAQTNGIPIDQLVVDPGIGFGKPVGCDLEIIRNLKAFRVLKRPILLGISRKNVIGQILGYNSPDDRLYGSLATCTVALLNGVHILRTHDVGASRDCIKMVTALQAPHECE